MTRSVEPIVHKAAWLYYTHGLRQEEVAERLDISETAAKVRSHRALTRLRLVLEEDDHE